MATNSVNDESESINPLTPHHAAGNLDGVWKPNNGDRNPSGNQARDRNPATMPSRSSHGDKHREQRLKNRAGGGKRRNVRAAQVLLAGKSEGASTLADQRPQRMSAPSKSAQYPGRLPAASSRSLPDGVSTLQGPASRQGSRRPSATTARTTKRRSAMPTVRRTAGRQWLRTRSPRPAPASMNRTVSATGVTVNRSPRPTRTLRFSSAASRAAPV